MGRPFFIPPEARDSAAESDKSDTRADQHAAHARSSIRRRPASRGHRGMGSRETSTLSVSSATNLRAMPRLEGEINSMQSASPRAPPHRSEAPEATVQSQLARIEATALSQIARLPPQDLHALAGTLSDTGSSDENSAPNSPGPATGDLARASAARSNGPAPAPWAGRPMMYSERTQDTTSNQPASSSRSFGGVTAPTSQTGNRSTRQDAATQASATRGINTSQQPGRRPSLGSYTDWNTLQSSIPMDRQAPSTASSFASPATSSSDNSSTTAASVRADGSSASPRPNHDETSATTPDVLSLEDIMTQDERSRHALAIQRRLMAQNAFRTGVLYASDPLAAINAVADLGPELFAAWQETLAGVQTRELLRQLLVRLTQSHNTSDAWLASVGLRRIPQGETRTT